MTANDMPCREAKLLPCPFCGEGNSIVSLWFDDVVKRYRVGCGRCGCSTGTSPRDKKEAPAIAAWNTRATRDGGEVVCTCPSGDGSLRWPCPAHPYTQPVGVTEDMLDAACEAYADTYDVDYGQDNRRQCLEAALQAALQKGGG
jgi:Lar family restriction alleviation protein